jgi:IclR family transcriptional regulator, acetate operon repressor
MGRTEPYPGTQAIRRAVSLLKAFTDRQPEWTLAELSEAVGLNKTTVYRAMAALEGEGLIERTPGGDGYRLGPELIVLGYRTLRTNDLRTVSHSELAALAEETGETAVLEIPVDGKLMILDEAMGSTIVRMQAEVGTRWPIHATSTGKAILAAAVDFLGGAAFDEFKLPENLPALTPYTLTSLEELKADLARVREAGYAVALQELQEGYAAVGAVVRNHEGRPVAAIGIGGPMTRVTEDRIPELGELTRIRADRVSRSLGAPVEEASRAGI